MKLKSILLILLLQFCLLPSYAQSGQVHLLSVNDMHAAIDRFPQFAFIVDSLRHRYPDLILLSAGDNRTGNPVNDIDPVPSQPMVELMNRTGFQYSAIGNHEFDGGAAGLRSVINRSNCRFLCANMYSPDSLRLHVEPFALTEHNHIRIGILGLVQTGDRTGHPDAHPTKIGNITFRPAEEVARDYRWIRRECDLFVLLTHIGFEKDLRLAQQMPEADLIIGGHSHTIVNPCRMENGVMITQAGSNLNYATLITVTLQEGRVTDRQAQLINIKDEPRKDAEVQAMVDSFNRDTTLKRVLTQAVSDFERKEELGCLMTDALRSELDADIAVHNSGGIRYSSKPKGTFTVSDVYRLDPFGNEVVEYNLTGEEVERMLIAVCRADGYGPVFVSGIRYAIRLGTDRHSVKGIAVTLPDGQPIDRKHTYRVVMNSYIAAIADFEKHDEGRNLFVTTSDVLIQYLGKQASIDYRGVSHIKIITDNK